MGRATGDVDIPDCAMRVWEAFGTLNASRSIGFDGANPISCQDILAWSSLYGERLMAWEIAAIFMLDKRVRGVEEPQPLTAQIFDKMFGGGKKK